jgi:hypothetical protein
MGLERSDDLAWVFNLVRSEPRLGQALNDLIDVLIIPGVAYVNCGRVIDNIRRMITPPGTATAPQAWEAMHTALNVSRPYQEWISEQSKGPRHADHIPDLSGEISMDLTHRTWTVMNRFLEYRKRGNQPLTPPEFPLLA